MPSTRLRRIIRGQENEPACAAQSDPPCAGGSVQAVASLRDAVSAGWGLLNDLKEPDFDAIRGRADFQKLVAEVEAKVEKVPDTAPPREKK